MKLKKMFECVSMHKFLQENALLQFTTICFYSVVIKLGLGKTVESPIFRRTAPLFSPA